VLLVRLSPKLEEEFGMTREFLVYCMNAEDLQSKAINQANWQIQNAENPIDPDHACLVVRDPKASQRVREWTVDGQDKLLVAPLVPLEIEQGLERGSADHQLVDHLKKWWFSRNLYMERSPVTGGSFFGRELEVQKLVNASRTGRHVGIFGLRKIGKTSLIQEAERRLAQDPNTLVSFLDRQGSAHAGSATHVAWRLGKKVANQCIEKGLLTPEEAKGFLDISMKSSLLNSRPSYLGEVIDGIAAMMTGPLIDTNVAVYLDEAEVLFRGFSEPLPGTTTLFQGLRSIAQETGRLSIVLAGVNSTPCERPQLNNIDNPLYGLLDITYLGPLDPDDCFNLIRVVGMKMGLSWNAKQARALGEAVGFHPLLSRLGASDVAESRAKRPWEVTAGDVDDMLREFSTRHVSELEQIVSSLHQYFPEEVELLGLIARGETDSFEEWKAEFPNAVNHLTGYGVMSTDPPQILIPQLRDFLARS